MRSRTDKAILPARPTAPTRRGHRRPRRQRPPETPPGFTLVELLVVLLILAILVSLAVGVGMYVFGKSAEQQTKTIQTVVMGAIQAYWDLNTAFDERDPNRYPGDANCVNPKATDSAGRLMGYLTARQMPEKPTVRFSNPDSDAVKASKERLLNLPTGATDANSSGLADGWGTTMRYQRRGGLGGKPVLVSAGADKAFGVDDPNKAQDDIRSDNP